MKIGLQISAQLENVTDLKPDEDDFRWYMKLKCNNCGVETSDYVYVNSLDRYQLKGSKGTAALIIKCKLCLRENCLDIIEGTMKPYTYDDCPNFKTVVVFDCRGVEPILYDPRGGWCIVGIESNLKFPDVNLSEDWADFDEKQKESVGIFELKHKFVRL